MTASKRTLSLQTELTTNPTRNNMTAV